jgi:hypothetical protein
MHNLKVILLAAAAAALAACGGGSDDTLVGGPVAGGTAKVATLTLLASSPQLPSDGATDATITALARDANNNLLPDIPVVFSASSGSLAVAQPPTTGATGTVTATLNTAGDPTNRSITVSATAGTAGGSVTVNVIGTTLTINGPTSLALGSSGPYNVVLTNAANGGIPNQQVTVTSSNNNGISATPLMTDAAGKATFSLTANNGGADTLTVSALGIQGTLSLNVSSDSFTFTVPAAGGVPEYPLGANVGATVQWLRQGAAMANSPINFSATRGTLSAATVNTDGAGNASITLTATNAGPAVITATNIDGTSAQRNIEFVATTPASLELQASPFTVPTSGQSALTAIVRDPTGNLVKNQTVTFTLTDVTGGSLTVAQARTDSQGRAQTFYNASTATSAVNGVQIAATVQGTAVTDSVNLTVARREVFISLGTGNEIFEPNTAQYRKEWVIQVTDAQGNGVRDVNLVLSILSERYWDGTRTWLTPIWRTNRIASVAGGCPDEDADRNGILSSAEDAAGNGNGRIEAGNILSVAPHGGSGTTVKTDAAGFALVDVFYPQEYAEWLQVTLQASTSVQGTESSEATTFIPPGLAADFTVETVAPPGLQSPFGTDGDCATPPPPDGP